VRMKWPRIWVAAVPAEDPDPVAQPALHLHQDEDGVFDAPTRILTPSATKRLVQWRAATARYLHPPIKPPFLRGTHRALGETQAGRASCWVLRKTVHCFGSSGQLSIITISSPSLNSLSFPLPLPTAPRSLRPHIAIPNGPLVDLH
jgi:hypothetical protein